MHALAILALLIAVVGAVAGVLNKEWAAVIVALAVAALAISPAFQIT